MTLDKIKEKLTNNIKNSVVTLTGDGCNCSATVVSPIFKNMTSINRQKMILSIVSDEIKKGELHALSIKALTPDENTKKI